MASMVMEAGVSALVTQVTVRNGLPKATVAVTGASTCSCGQALECCHTAHCPRCGVTLHG